MSLGSCFRKIELSLRVEKCRLLGPQVKFHSSNSTDQTLPQDLHVGEEGKNEGGVGGGCPQLNPGSVAEDAWRDVHLS